MIPHTITELDAEIAREHAAIDDAIEHCQEGVEEWHVQQIARLEDLRPALEAGTPTLQALIRTRRRGLAERYACATWAGETMRAAALKAEIERLERGRF